MVVLDGGSGLPVKELNGMTCLEAAKKPSLNLLASQSSLGLIDVIGRGIAPQSDAAAFSLLGYNPLKYYVARGVLEAVGAGVKIGDYELALRCNLASVNGNKLITPRVRVTKELSLSIERLINERLSLDVPFTLDLLNDYRGVLVFHDNGLSDQVTNTHPGYLREAHNNRFISKASPFKAGVNLKDCKALNKDAAYTADLINNFVRQSHEVLNKAGLKDKLGNKINYLLLRDAGNRLPSFPIFYSKFKLLMAMIAEMPVELGVAKMLGLEVVKPNYNDLRTVYAAVLDELDENDSVYVHIKGPDKQAHNMNVAGKVKSIEEIDKEFIEPLMAAINLNNTVVCVTCDHSTPVKFGVHSADPVPVMITGKSDGINEWSEKSCAKGSLGRFPGHELMPLLIKKL